MEQVGINQARPKLGDICRRVAAGQRTGITDHGTTVAIMMSPQEVADLEDYAAIGYNRLHPHEEVIVDDARDILDHLD